MRYRLLLICALLLFCGLPPTARGAALAGMLPRTYDETCTIAGWWASEKLDGVRASWDGAALWSKNGQRLQPPPEFVAQLPAFALEGELWGGRGGYEKTAAIVLQQHPHDGWRQLQLAIFDVPDEPGSFTRRIAKAVAWLAAHPSPYAFVIAQSPLRDRAQLQEELRRVQELGGEGLIVRDPEALYTAGRSAEVLKVKEYADAEALVIAHLPGRGQNRGKLGALLVERPDGTRFKLGSGFSAAERSTPPPIGTVITYKYYGFFASGLPRFPSYLRIRQDHAL
ncbi:MAG: DNA ligase [Desulfuromonadales bacterium GWC2_61_20]|nr:MAG: DNA ligase [Desulfuromonadales bacterium GWC2_61_20]